MVAKIQFANIATESTDVSEIVRLQKNILQTKRRFRLKIFTTEKPQISYDFVRFGMTLPKSVSRLKFKPSIQHDFRRAKR